MNFHVGQQVVCIWRIPNQGYGWEIVPEVDGVYTIRSIDFIGVDAFLRFEEITNRPASYPPDFGEVRFCVSCFRPVKTADISIFTKMLAPTPKEREPA